MRYRTENRFLITYCDYVRSKSVYSNLNDINRLVKKYYLIKIIYFKNEIIMPIILD